MTNDRKANLNQLSLYRNNYQTMTEHERNNYQTLIKQLSIRQFNLIPQNNH